MIDDDAMTMRLCQWLDDAGLGAFDRTPGPDEPVIYYGALREDSDRAIGVTPYASADDVVLGTGTRWVQFRYRGAVGDVRGAITLAGQGFEALQGVHHRDGIARVRRTSSAILGPDENDRQERTDNYEIILNTASALGGTP